MKVRIKYCGGCNPRYDRKAVTERLRGQFPDAEFIEMGDEAPYDHVIVLCGCPAACASHEDLQGIYGKTVISSQEESASLDGILRNLPK